MARRRGQRKGHLFERSGWWLLRYRVDSPEGRERITVPVARSSGSNSVGKREAQRIAWDEYLSKLDVMSTRPSSMKTLREFVEQRFEPDVMANLKRSGRAFYKNILWGHVLPTLGTSRLRDIGVGQVQTLINAQLAAGLSTQTAVHVRNCLSAVLRHARTMQWFAGELPTASVRMPEMKRKERRAMTWEQVCLLAKALPEPVSTLAVFLTLTGLRIGEAMGLRWKYCNLGDDMRIVNGEVLAPLSITVRESYVRGQYETTKSVKSRRTMILPVWFAPRMWQLMARGEWIGPEDPVFAGRHGKPLDQHNLAADFLKPAAKELKMPWVSWHVFRHTNSTLADQGGFSVSERQRILGHASEAMTMHYTHSELDKLRERLEIMVDPKKLQ